MHVKPSLSLASVRQIPPANIFLAPNSETLFGVYIRVPDQATSHKAVAALDLTNNSVAVQLAPRSLTFNWLTTLPADTPARDVTAALALAYEPLPANLHDLPVEAGRSLTTGDLILDGGTTKLVFLGPNPAIGLGIIDLATGELSNQFGANAIRVLSWHLMPRA